MYVSKAITDFLADPFYKEGHYMIFAKDYNEQDNTASCIYFIFENEANKKKYKKITLNKKIKLIRGIYHV